MSEPVILFFHAESETWHVHACSCDTPPECHREEDGGALQAFKALPRAEFDALTARLDAVTADVATHREEIAAFKRSEKSLFDFAQGRGDGYPVSGFLAVVRNEIASLRALLAGKEVERG